MVLNNEQISLKRTYNFRTLDIIYLDLQRNYSFIEYKLTKSHL